MYQIHLSEQNKYVIKNHFLLKTHVVLFVRQEVSACSHVPKKQGMKEGRKDVSRGKKEAEK